LITNDPAFERHAMMNIDMELAPTKGDRSGKDQPSSLGLCDYRPSCWTAYYRKQTGLAESPHQERFRSMILNGFGLHSFVFDTAGGAAMVVMIWSDV
jgi:hypothetical protein